MNEKDIKVENYLRKDFYSISAEESLSKAVGVMKEKGIKGLVVLKNREYVGVITEEVIKKSYLDPQTTKVKSLTIKAPKVVGVRDDIYKGAYFMFHAHIPILPVFDGNDIVGILEIKRLIKKYAEVDREFAQKNVLDVGTGEVIIIYEDESVGKALRLFRENKFTRLPVLNRNGKLVGIITLVDVVEKLLEPKHRETKPKTHKGTSKEKIHVVEYPVREVMTNVVFTVDDSSTLEEAIDLMVENNISSLVILEGDIIRGIITDKDILSEIASKYVKPQNFIVLPSIAGDVVDLDKSELEKALDHVREVLERYGDFLRSGRVYVYIKEHEEVFRGVPLYHVRIRASTEKGLFISQGQTWGLYNAIGTALRHLRNQIEYKKALEKDPYLGLKSLVKEVADATVLPTIKGNEREI